MSSYKILWTWPSGSTCCWTGCDQLASEDKQTLRIISENCTKSILGNVTDNKDSRWNSRPHKRQWQSTAVNELNRQCVVNKLSHIWLTKLFCNKNLKQRSEFDARETEVMIFLEWEYLKWTWRSQKSSTMALFCVAWLTDWVKVLRPTRHKIGHSGDVPQANLFAWYGKTKSNTTKARTHQSKEMYYNTK